MNGSVNYSQLNLNCIFAKKSKIISSSEALKDVVKFNYEESKSKDNKKGRKQCAK